jgi:nanoRNase/pAp phosphatase (c-di-AMP/oligoRNAs hydrolase)
MALTASERLRRFYALFAPDDRTLVIINADPDAIASAMAVKRLLWRKVSTVTLASINTIQRPDNLAMIDLLGVQLLHMKDVKRSEYNRLVLVDSQPCHNDSFENLNINAIIDHHPDTNAQADYLDIRPKYGATATILTEYLRAAKVKPSAKLATGLFYAIKTDTNGFKGQTLIEDVRAFQFLFRFANIYLARKIEQADLKPEFLKFFKFALENRRIRKSKLFVHLGAVSNPDVCVLIADFFMRVSTVTWSIVSGVYNRKLIIIFRNDGLRKNAGLLAQKSFGCFGSAGGHKDMARAEIMISQLKETVDVTDDKKVASWINRRIEKGAGKKK